jgi:hypothetical protein
MLTVEESTIFAKMMPDFIETIKIHPLSLWECWRYVYEIYQHASDALVSLYLHIAEVFAKIRTGLQELLRFLRAQPELLEYHLSDIGDRYSFQGGVAAVSKDAPTSMRCRCLGAHGDRSRYTSFTSYDRYLTPCECKDCILLHLIMFRLTTFHPLSTSQEPSSSGQYSTSDITEEVITKLDSMWSSML